MQPAHSADLRRQRVIVLHEIKVQPRVPHPLLVPAFAEKPLMIAKPRRGQHHNTGN